MDLINWLMQRDPAIRWQVLGDLDGASGEVAAEQTRVETEGWGARLMGLQNPDGHWARGACSPQWVADQWRATRRTSARAS